MRVSPGYRSLIGVLLAGLSAVSAPFAGGGGAAESGRQIVRLSSPRSAAEPVGFAKPTQKMVAEYEARAGATRQRQKFDIYRKRLFNRRRLRALTLFA